MRTATVLTSLALLAGQISAQNTLREITPQEILKANEQIGGKLLPCDDAGGGQMLKVHVAAKQPYIIPLITIEDPRITAATYAIEGRVRHEDVEGKGYLEMWNHFPKGARYFTRALAPRGPLKALKGASPWRRFVLPFHIKGNDARPEKLVLNLVLPAGGTVYLSSMQLIEYPEGTDPMAARGQWWSDRVGGIIGAFIGVIGGCLGALVGGLSARGKGMRFVMPAMTASAAVGVVLLALGLVALLSEQPYGVWYPPLLGGVILTIVMGSLRPVIRKRYQALELRRMDAMDAT